MGESAEARNARSEMKKLKESKKVFFANEAALENKLTRLASEKSSAVQIVTDFDYTISQFSNPNGKRMLTTHDVCDRYLKKANVELYKKLRLLRKKYRPIEYSSHISMQEKIPHMEAWWRSAHSCIVQSGLRDADFEELAMAAEIDLREGFDSIVGRLDTSGIPVTVFSAGIANIIRTILGSKLGEMPVNMRVIGNEFKFNEEGVICGFSEPVIHTYNKNIRSVSCKDEFLATLKNRNNLILFGDTLGDANMDLGISKDGCVLKIGFLNEMVSELKESYMQAYDIVITDQYSFSIAGEILLLILCSFDHAISKYCNREGKKMCTTQCVFDDIMRVMNMKQFNKVQFLRSKCAGIDQTAFMKNKSLATDLELYWKMMHETIAKLGVNAAQVAELISIANIELKDGFSEFARKTEQAAIPLIIFSTGISNVIGTLLLQNIGAIPTNVHIVGNEFFVDKMGCFYGVRTPLIHRYNKSYALLSSRSSLVDSSNSAKTFVLIGNSLENVSAAGRMRDKIALRIGFLNHDVDALKHTYMEKYDVVVTDPFSFAVPNKLLLSLLENC